MNIDARIGIIGGNGWLGNAIAHALVSSGTLEASRLTLSGRSERRGTMDIPGAYWTRDNDELAARSDVVLLSVRPEDFSGVEIDASGKLVISVMASIRARTMAERLGSDAVVRSIPNAAAAIRRSFTPWFAMPAVTAEGKKIVQALFDACGEGAETTSEADIDYCVAMTGTGAAFPALLAEALVAHAVKQGLTPEFARRAAKGVVAEASQLFAGDRADPAEIVREMINYRGATAAALQTTLDQGFNEAVAAGLEAAIARAAELSPEK